MFTKVQINLTLEGKTARSGGLNVGDIKKYLQLFSTELKMTCVEINKLKRKSLVEALELCQTFDIEKDITDYKIFNNLKLGLCCKFLVPDIKFKETRVTHVKDLTREKQLNKYNAIVLHNSNALLKALKWCTLNHIECFRVTSGFCPVYSHPEHGYTLRELPEYRNILKLLQECKSYVERGEIRLIFHPGQFNVLSSNKESVVENTIKELEYHNTIAELIGVDVINVHGGGVYDDKEAAITRLTKNVKRLSPSLRNKLTLENDEKCYCVEDLIGVCRETGVKLLFDIHHHRCYPGNLSEEEAFDLSKTTWGNTDVVVHISSPKDGWGGKKIYPHHDYIDIDDFPDMWLPKNLQNKLYVEVEAKSKELAVKKLMSDISAKLD